MIINPKQTTIAYRCPRCGQGVKSIVGIFSLTGDKMKLKCPCGASALDIERTREEKYRITVPCMLCGSDHKLTISPQTFFEKEKFSYPCTYSGVDCLFLGSEKSVEEALEKNENEVIELFKSIGVENPGEILSQTYDEKERDEVEDVDVLDTIVFVLRDLMETDSIKCGCDTPDFDFLMCDGYVKVFCRSCQRSADIPARGRCDADKFLDCFELKLK